MSPQIDQSPRYHRQNCPRSHLPPHLARQVHSRLFHAFFKLSLFREKNLNNKSHRPLRLILRVQRPVTSHVDRVKLASIERGKIELPRRRPIILVTNR